MSLLKILADKKVWIDFYERKSGSGFTRISDAQEMFRYIRNEDYRHTVRRILTGQGLSLPNKKNIAKSGSSKKRTVYSLPEEEATVLKLLTWLIIRKYDASLSDNLYSFRPGYGVKDALGRILHDKDISRCHSYKIDVRNYFNSIDVQLLIPMLRELFADDKPLYDFMARQLSDPYVLDGENVIAEKKGVMAGMPYAGFLANVYLSALDREFENMSDVIYCRYSDDIIVFAEDRDALDAAKKVIYSTLYSLHLEVNHDKEVETSPGETWTFLGFVYDGKCIDVSEVSVNKLKAKMRRRARALLRWQKQKGKEPWMAARAFIKHFNRKLYTSDDLSEINWSWWYFPFITTDKSLKEIDAYMQECVRYIATGCRTKRRYNFRYSQMKDLGLCSLVNMWYRFQRGDMTLANIHFV